MSHVADPIPFQPLDAGPLAALYVERFDDWTDLAPRQSEPPHRHAFHEMIWFARGAGIHRIDGTPITIVPQTVCLIAEGQIHGFDQAVGLSGFMVCFLPTILPSAAQGQLPDLHTFFHAPRHKSWPIQPSEQPLLQALADSLAAAYDQAGGSASLGMIQHLLAAFLLAVGALQAAQQAAARPGLPVAHAFLDLLETRYTTAHDVGFYAAALGLSQAHLTRQLRQATGKSAKQLILDRLMLEARRYLQFTSLPIQQISAALGYHDPFHFSKQFKQHLGQTPQAYRDQAHE